MITRALDAVLGGAGAAASALLAILLLAAPTPAGAADPFYLELLRAGREAYARQDFPAAAEKLRLACFGFLEEPALLREGLVHLALAQSAAADSEGFLTSFGRITDLERRFPEIMATPLSQDVREAFETLALERVPAAQLAAMPALAAVAEQRAVAALATLPPRQRRAELEKRAVAAPGEARWALMLAQLELDQGRPEAAAKRLGVVLAADAGNAEARCLRGRALAEAGNCDEAAADLRACAASLTDRLLAGERLECLVKKKNWVEGSEVVAALPDSLRQDPGIAKLVSKIAAGAAASAVKSAPAPAATPPKSAAGKPPATSPKPAAPSPIPPARPSPPLGPAPPPAVEPLPAFTAGDHEQLETARKLMDAAQVTSDLAEALRLASEVADRHPRDRESQLLTAEIAYRASQWATAVRHFQRADPGDRQPALLFYYAVALFELGDREAAAATLKRCLPELERTPMVESYAARILGPSEGSR